MIAVAPYWNVNLYKITLAKDCKQIAVAPYWNVNGQAYMKVDTKEDDSSSSILKCKCRCRKYRYDIVIKESYRKNKCITLIYYFIMFKVVNNELMHSER
ncbi:MAG: hypothetical protein ACRDBA_18105 [Clostridium sp.]